MASRIRARSASVVVLVGLLLSTTLALTSPAASASGIQIPLTTFRDLIVDPASGRVFVSGDDEVFVYSADGEVTHTIPSIFGAGGMDITGSSLWVAETTAAKLAEIDLNTLSVTRHVNAGRPVTGSSLAVIGGAVWFASNSTLARLDPATSTVTTRGSVLEGEFERIGTSTSGLLTYGIGSSGVRFVDISTNPATPGSFVHVGGGGGNLQQVAVNPVANRYVTASGAPYYFPEVDIASMSPSGVIYPATNYPVAVSYSSAFGGIFAGGTSSTDKVFVWRAGEPTAVVTSSLPEDLVHRGIAQSPDGTKVYALTQSDFGATTARLRTIDLRPAVGAAIPSQVVAGVPAEVEVFGANLERVTAATVGGLPAEVRSTSSTKAAVAMPTGLSVGPTSLVVTTAIGTASIGLTVVANTGAALLGAVEADWPLPDIAMTLAGGALATPVVTTTDADGRYEFSGIPYGTSYTLTAHDPTGTYPDQRVAGITLTPNLSTSVDITMTPAQTGSGATLAEAELGAQPRDLLVEPNTNRAFVTVGDEVRAFDSDGNLLARFQGQWGADGLTRDGTDVYVNLKAAGKITRIDAVALTVTGTWATGRPTSGGIVHAGGRLWFSNGNDQWTNIASLNPATGTVVDTPGSWYVPRFRSITGSTSLFYAYDVGLSPPSSAVMNGAAATASVVSSAWGVGGPAAASAASNRLWTTSGAEYELTTMQPTGVSYPATGASPVAHTPVRGGLLAFGAAISRVGTPQTIHEIPATPALTAFDAGGDRLLYADGTKLVVWDLAPHLVSVSPTPLYSDVTSLTITGDGLRATTQVRLDGVPVPFTVDSGNQLMVSVPPMSLGLHSLQVTSGWGDSNTLTFTRSTPPPPPEVDGLSPTSTSTAGGDVTITGSSFTGATEVRFGTESVPFHVEADDTIVAAVPAHAGATVEVFVTTAGGTNTTSPSFSWVAPTPVVTSVTPTSGPSTGGTLVTVHGTGFLYATEVSFDGTPAANFTVIDDSTALVNAPPHSVGPVTVSVTTAGGSSAAGAGTTFTYHPGPPRITSLSPAHGPTEGGNEVVISGERFGDTTAVRFGGIAAESFTVIDEATIVAVAPPRSSGVVTVTVQTIRGNSPWDPSAAYTYDPVVPSAPSGVTGAPGNGSIVLSWTPPASNGGAPITGYRVHPAIGGVPQPALTFDSSVTSQTIAGLTNGTPYTFTVAALNAQGAGPSSEPSPEVVPGTPGRPTITTVTGRHGAATVSWTPAAANGSPVTGYVLTPYIGGVAQAPHLVTSSPTTVDGLTNGTAYTFTVAGVNAVGVGRASAPSTAVTPAADLFVPMSPTRVQDSRVGSQVGPYGSPWSAGTTRDVQVTGGVTGVPADADAVVLNVTATGTTDTSFLTLWPAGEQKPLASSLNWSAGWTVPNAVTVKVGEAGKVSVFNNRGDAHVVIDVVGYYRSGVGAGYTAMSPTRVQDSRVGSQVGPYGSPWSAGTTRDVQVTGGVTGVPADADAVVLNVTATGTTDTSFLTLWPAGEQKPLASSLNWSAGWTVPNAVTVKVGAAGKVSVFNNRGDAHVVIDVVGYYRAGTGGAFHPLSPTRVQDSRAATQVGSYSTPWQAGSSRPVSVAGGPSGVPAGAAAVLLNVTATGTTAPSFLTVWPAGQAQPLASSLNWTSGWTIANAVTAKVGAGGQVGVYNNQGAVHVIADVAGWFG